MENIRTIEKVLPEEAIGIKTRANSSLFDFSQIGKMIVALGITGGVAFHFLGFVTHLSYLRTWGIDPGQFPKPIDWIQINGYYTLFDRVSALVLAMITNVREFTIWGIFFFIW